jgi:hypothetical protein
VRLRPLSESECYARCYGQRGDESVRLVRVIDPEPRVRLTADAVRRLFEGRREPEAQAAA